MQEFIDFFVIYTFSMLISLNEIELCQDENQDRVNEFQFRFHEKFFRQYEMNFYCGNEFRSCKIDSLFGKVELHAVDFQFCSGGIDIHFGEIQMEKI